MKSSEKKEWAKLLYVKERLSQKEVAAKVVVSTVTMNKWVKAGNWDALRQSMLVTREEQLRRMYMQMEELNTAIMGRKEGERFANSKEADILSKLTVSIRTLESEASIADIMEVAKRLLAYLRPVNAQKAQELALVFDDFIKDTLKR